MRKILATLRDGAVGAEFTLWCGFGAGVEQSHGFLRLGVVTLYVARWRLDRLLAMWRTAREKLGGK